MRRKRVGKIDWARVDATTDAAIAKQIARNPDDVEFTDQMLDDAVWVVPAKKVPISFRVDPDVLEFFRAAGEGYQSRMNAVLRGYMRGYRRGHQRVRERSPSRKDRSRSPGRRKQ